MDITKHFIILAVAVTLAVFQLSRLPKADTKPGPFDRQFASTAAHANQDSAGFLSDDAAEDWHNLLNAALTRFSKHTGSVDVFDGRSEGGRGFRRLLLHASASQWTTACDTHGAAWSCLTPVDSEHEEGVVLPLLLAHPALLATAVEAGSSRSPARAGGSGSSRQFFSPKKKPAVPPRPHMQLPGSKRSSTWRSLTSWLGTGAGAMGGNSVERQAGPGRGKAARAFGAGQRGPGLINRAARSKSFGDPPSLTVYLHAHIAGITCCHEGQEGGLQHAPPVLHSAANMTALLSSLQASSGGPSLAMGGGGDVGGRVDAVGALAAFLRDVRRLHIATVVDAAGRELDDSALGLSSQARPLPTRSMPSPAPSSLAASLPEAVPRAAADDDAGEDAHAEGQGEGAGEEL